MRACPLTRPVAGIAMGLIKEGAEFAVLSDILGDEDHLGDMDFKVAGTEKGVTSLQMDIKITGITEEIMRVALDQARDGRMHILGEMNKALTGARTELGEHAPRIETITIPTDKIREVIGSGGSVIRGLVEETGAKIDISDDGTVKVAASKKESIDLALKRIKEIVSEPEVGTIYKGKVVKIMDFGAFVNFFGAKDGLVHISQLSRERARTTGDVVKEGQEVLGQADGLRRPRQDAPVHEGRRPDDRQGGSQGGTGARRQPGQRRASAAPRRWRSRPPSAPPRPQLSAASLERTTDKALDLRIGGFFLSSRIGDKFPVWTIGRQVFVSEPLRVGRRGHWLTGSGCGPVVPAACDSPSAPCWRQVVHE